jgi:hypothetical protein
VLSFTLKLLFSLNDLQNTKIPKLTKKTIENNKTKAPFDSQNRPLEWNGYSYGIVILLFGMDLFIGIIIPIGIPIHLRRGIPIALKNERNSYSLR